jgi:hypothetical protein
MTQQIKQKLELIAKLVLSDYTESPKCGEYYIGGETLGESFIDLADGLDVTVSQDYSLTTDPSTHFTKNQSDWVDETYGQLIKDFLESKGLPLDTNLTSLDEEVIQEFDDNWLCDSYSPIERTILNFNAFYREPIYQECGACVVLELSILYRNAPYLPFTSREILVTVTEEVESFLKMDVKKTLDFMFNSNNWNQ